jgi:hypothetical protein
MIFPIEFDLFPLTELERQVVDEFLSQGWRYSSLFTRRELVDKESGLITVIMPGMRIEQYYRV